MPDFQLAVSGASLAQWLDPGTASRPSRLRPHAGRTMCRYVGTTGVGVVLTGIVGGVSAPLDSALGGRLFVAASQESPLGYAVAWSFPTGQSSVQTFVPLVAGHYLVYLRRSGTGSILAHIDIEDP